MYFLERLFCRYPYFLKRLSAAKVLLFFEICKRERDFFCFFREIQTFRSAKVYLMSGFNPDAMDKVSAALTCGAADKDKPAARMPPKGTQAAEAAFPIRHAWRMPKRKCRKKSNKEKATGFLVLFFFPCFTREEMGKICR